MFNVIVVIFVMCCSLHCNDVFFVLTPMIFRILIIRSLTFKCFTIYFFYSKKILYILHTHTHTHTHIYIYIQLHAYFANIIRIISITQKYYIW